MSSTWLRIEAVSGESARVPRFEPLQSRLPEPGQAGNQPGPAAESREQRRRGHYTLRDAAHRRPRTDRACFRQSAGRKRRAFRMGAEHSGPITNAVGHAKSFYLDQFAEQDHFVLETCMYFPFITAKSLTGFGAEHSRFIQAFPKLQMILVLACDDIDEHNRITIDAQGKPVVHYRFTPQVVRGLVKGALASARIFFAAGAERCHMPVSSGSTTIEARAADRLGPLAQRS